MQASCKSIGKAAALPVVVTPSRGLHSPAVADNEAIKAPLLPQRVIQQLGISARWDAIHLWQQVRNNQSPNDDRCHDTKGV